ncbi:proton extrusion protein PcxA [Trichocoleus sp. FACHB-591]|uniref:proton extrusion protein PcxA n=1 Tax=Trichocoleus sp. FACHB-591 TaxID=2692872 RepID=UPI001685DBA2|nr:proton extrusion protein PcxA [Trichocoleus sp. FACHB-591]MBD2094159.1 proton extrusion protein PcxA [Trichocoleus sp. FACHB-591]
MKTSTLAKLRNYVLTASSWLFNTPERSLDQAYDAALMIKAIEDEHFQGSRISVRSDGFSSNVSSYFQAELRKYLNIARFRLTEFKASRLFVDLSNQTTNSFKSTNNSPEQLAYEARDKAAIILEKLRFIDEVLARYSPQRPAPIPQAPPTTSLVPVAPTLPTRVENPNNTNEWVRSSTVPAPATKVDKASEGPNIVPRSILRTFIRLRRDLDPKSEAEVVENFRNTKARTIISIRFILLVILIPLLTQQVTKNFFIGPVVDRFRDHKSAEIFLNPDMEEEAFIDLQKFEERLKFKSLIGTAPRLTGEDIETQVKERAVELAREYSDRSANAIKNVFADLLSLIAFACVITASKREIAVVKAFMDEVVYGLSDSAKAFIIILFTDIFVGFHSPHGWEVILGGVSRHLGLPENHDFIFLFIATFPVILDTVFKYWIFRYLNRISPSAVATYRNMNE